MFVKRKRRLKMKKMYGVSILFLAFSVIALFASAEGKEGSNSILTRVEPIKVCMVNDQVFEKDQIPVVVDSKTYYGCCQMCKKTLAEKEEFREAKDPVSNNVVDKAKAVIGATKDGKTYYFESEKTFEEYNKRAGN
jgi:YHS domain-containing protein